jgi:hypothetical protein
VAPAGVSLVSKDSRGYKRTDSGRPEGHDRPALGRGLLCCARHFALVTNEFLLVGLLGGISRDLAVTDGVADGAVTIPGLTPAIAAPVLDDRCPARRPESRADGD